jgi:hypothetical protein
MVGREPANLHDSVHTGMHTGSPPVSTPQTNVQVIKHSHEKEGMTAFNVKLLPALEPQYKMFPFSSEGSAVKPGKDISDFPTYC